MVINNSPDIGVLEVEIVFDLTGAAPVINLTNQTTANNTVSPIPNLNVLDWALNIYSPTGTPIYQSDFTTPWQASGTGPWTTEAITAPWPNPFNQIEWGQYRVEFQVKDSNGTIYNLYKSTNICKPVGNNKQADVYGHVKIDVEALCASASLYIKDTSSKLYQGITGVNQESYLAVDYPRDGTGTLPAPYVLTTFVTDAIVPFYTNGETEATYYSLWRYDLGDNVFIIIRYVGQEAFQVQCNIDLCPIACEVKALEDSITNGSCTNADDAQKKLNKITPRLLRAFIAKANPTCGVDLPALIDEIKAIGGFTCDCSTVSTGIGTTTPEIGPFVFSVNNQGGDVVASFSVTDGNVVLNIKDKSYSFGGNCIGSSSTAISLVPTTSGTNTAVCLNTDIAALAEDIYAATASSPYLLNLFCALNALCGGGGGIVVDGKCIINNNACDIDWVLDGITGSNATLVFLQVAGVYQTINFTFNTGDLTPLQTYLNTLGLGTFAVTDLGGNQVKISTTANTENLGDIIYRDSSGSNAKKTATTTRNCNALAQLTTSEIIQAIIDYLCALDDTQVVTSQDYEICYIDPTTLIKKTVTVPLGSTLSALYVELLARGCDTINFIMAVKGLSCGSLQALFTPALGLMGANDFLMGTAQGKCTRLYPVLTFTRMMQLAVYDQDARNAFCILVGLCNGGQPCQPYSVLNVLSVENSPADNQLTVVVTFTHPEAIKALIRYKRIDLGSEWSVPAEVLPGASPYSTPSVADGQYMIGITPVYADGRYCGEITKLTAVCGAISSFSAAFDGSDINVAYAATSPKVKVNVQFPNGGTFTQIYTTGDPIVITPPGDVFGIFTANIQPVCNETTEWYGAQTAPAVMDVQAPSNSTITNNSSLLLSQVMISTVNTEGVGEVILSPTTLAASVGAATFYIAPGFYPEISVISLTTSLGWTGTLVAGISYPLVAGKFNNVTVTAGIAITLIDTSP